MTGGGPLDAEHLSSVRRATASLLWNTSRPETDPDSIRSDVRAGADLELAADVAVTQRLSPLVWRALVASGVDTGGGWARLLAGDAERCRGQALLVQPRLGELALRPLADAGFEPLVFKGCALADRYPAPWLRPMDDIDLFLPSTQIDNALTVLQQAGWRVAGRPVPYEVTLTHEAAPGLPVDLHSDVSNWRDRSVRLTSGAMWGWRRPSVVCGAPAFCVPPEEEIVLLAAHAAKPFHLFDRLIWIVDIAVVVAATVAHREPLDWSRVEEVADAMRCRTALAVALDQATRLGVVSPDRLRTVAARGTRLSALAPVLASEWPLVERDIGLRQRLRYALVDDWRLRLTLLVAQVTEEGAAGAGRRVLDLGPRGLRRWWRLRRLSNADGNRSR